MFGVGAAPNRASRRAKYRAVRVDETPFTKPPKAKRYAKRHKLRKSTPRTPPLPDHVRARIWEQKSEEQRRKLTAGLQKKVAKKAAKSKA